MTRKYAFFTVLAGLHLVLVICGAFKRPLLPKELPASEPLRIYGAVSGADSNYGFFAPSVGPQLRAIFTLTDRDGKSWTDTLTRGLNAEATLRAGNTVSVIASPELTEETRKALVTSWALAMFNKHPTVVELIIRVEVFDPPTMTEFQEGTRPEWKMVEQFGPIFRDSEPKVVTSK